MAQGEKKATTQPISDCMDVARTLVSALSMMEFDVVEAGTSKEPWESDSEEKSMVMIQRMTIDGDSREELVKKLIDILLNA